MLPNAKDPLEEPSKKGFHFHHFVPGPAGDPDRLRAKYEPVSCDFSDELESLSVQRLPVHVAFWDETRSLIRAKGRIVDIFTSPGKEEFLCLEDGSPGGRLVRLDRILEVRSG